MLLVLACSDKKNQSPRAALTKYAGRQFASTMNAYIDPAGMYAAGHDVVILSAKFGIVPAYRTLPDYDTKMTPAIAADWLADDDAFDAFAQAADGHDEVAVYGGALYRSVVSEWAERLGLLVTEVVGENRGCGDHYSALSEMFSEEA